MDSVKISGVLPHSSRTMLGKIVQIRQKPKRRTSCPCPSTNEMNTKKISLFNSHPASRSFHSFARYWRTRGSLYMYRVRSLLRMCYVPLVAGTSFESRPNRGSSTLTVVCCGSILFDFEYGHNN